MLFFYDVSVRLISCLLVKSYKQMSLHFITWGILCSTVSCVLWSCDMESVLMFPCLLALWCTLLDTLYITTGIHKLTDIQVPVCIWWQLRFVAFVNTPTRWHQSQHHLPWNMKSAILFCLIYNINRSDSGFNISDLSDMSYEIRFYL